MKDKLIFNLFIYNFYQSITKQLKNIYIVLKIIK